jgi:LacI family transcriptional regulator
MDTVNLKKLAAELGLSPSTISRALRDSHEISKKTKDRVKALAEKLDFRPNPHASSLRQNKSKTIAVIMPEIENNFFAQVINGVESVAQKKGYHVLIYLTHEDFEKEKAILQMLRNGRVDGLMISISNSTKSSEHLKSCQEAGLPMVFFDRICENIDVPIIATDDIDSSFRATEHLLKSGCRHITHLSMSDALSISKGRQAGYNKALEKYKLSRYSSIIECSSDDEKNRQIIRKLLLRKQRPDGIFASVEKLAINTYEVCRELKIEIPATLKVVSFSNLTAAALFHPPLTTVVQPAYDIGKEAANILFRIIDKKVLSRQEKKIIIPSTLVMRASTN